MFKLNKRNLLNLEHVKNTPSLNSNSKGVNNKKQIEKIKLKEIKDINGMKIIYEAIRKKN